MILPLSHDKFRPLLFPPDKAGRIKKWNYTGLSIGGLVCALAWVCLAIGNGRWFPDVLWVFVSLTVALAAGEQWFHHKRLLLLLLVGNNFRAGNYVRYLQGQEAAALADCLLNRRLDEASLFYIKHVLDVKMLLTAVKGNPPAS